jgi:CBS domain-containing protein
MAGDCRLARVRVREAMTEPLVTARPECTVREVARLMREHDAGLVVLVDGERTVGVLTDRDLVLSVLADGRDGDDPAVTHASSPVLGVSPDAEAADAAALMARHGVRRLLVLEEGRVAGIVSLEAISARTPARR